MVPRVLTILLLLSQLLINTAMSSIHPETVIDEGSPPHLHLFEVHNSSADNTNINDHNDDCHQHFYTLLTGNFHLPVDFHTVDYGMDIHSPYQYLSMGPPTPPPTSV